MTMPRSENDLAEALAQSDAWLDAVNPDELPDDAIDDRKDLRQIGMALISIEAAEQALISAVANARANKRSWTDIANVLGVSRQAARQRFDGRIAERDRDVSLRFPASSLPESERLAVQTYLAQLEAEPACSMLSKRLRVYLGMSVHDDELRKELADLAKAAREQHERG
jgi:hypothetical protein